MEFRLAFCPTIPCLKQDDVFGPKIWNPNYFYQLVNQPIAEMVLKTTDDAVNLWDINLLNAAVKAAATSGIGQRTSLKKDFVMRVKNNRVGVYLKRERALPVTSCVVTFVTVERYRRDYLKPGSLTEAELAMVTHVVVVVHLRSTPEASPMRTPHEFIVMMVDTQKSDRYRLVDWMYEEAKRVNDFWREYVEVAD